jgi:hypothetical protein
MHEQLCRSNCKLEFLSVHFLVAQYIECTTTTSTTLTVKSVSKFHAAKLHWKRSLWDQENINGDFNTDYIYDEAKCSWMGS